MDIRTELHNLKRMVLNESHISETTKEKIANRIFEIEKSAAINYTHCCKSDSEQLPSFLYKSDGGLYFKHRENTDVTEHWNEYLKTR